MKKPATKKRGSRAGLTHEESRLLTRHNLLAAAKIEFAEHGLEGANLRDILKRAGVSAGAFYYNFEDKTDLFLLLLQEAAGELHNLLHELRTKRVRESVIDQVEDTFRSLLLFGKENRHLLVLMHRESLSGNPKVAAFIERDQQAYMREAESDFRFLVEQKVIPPVDPKWASRAVVTFCTAALIEQLRSPQDEQTWVRAMARFLIGGMPLVAGLGDPAPG